MAADPPPRLQKLIADAGLASRRQAEAWIRAGRVRVNGDVAGLGDRAGPADVVTVDGRPLPEPAQACRVLAYHKPRGQVTSRRDERGRPTVFDDLPDPSAGRWIAVGRLDFQTSGLLLLTTDGALANRLMHPRGRLQRRYRVQVRGAPRPAQLERLLAGVELEDGPASFEYLRGVRGPGGGGWYEVALREGRNREVRRMWQAVGGEVSRLVRVGYGPVSLARDHPVGEARMLSGEEVRGLRRAGAGAGGDAA